MKKIVILCLSLACVLTGCNKAEIIDNPGQEGKDCLVSINPVGEITTSETPLSKASLTDDIYCVQVYQGSDFFAMGYFDNLESMKLYLKQGSKYRIIVAMVKDAKNLLGTRFNLTQNSIKLDGNKDVFDYRYNSSSGSLGSVDYRSDYLPLNLYQYNFKNSLQYYSSASSTSLSSRFINNATKYLNLHNISNGILGDVKYPACTDWFYGEVNDYTPTGDYETLDMDFRRVGFKLKYELSGVTDGEVTVKVYNSTRTFIDNTTNTATYSGETQFIAFYDTKSAWQYAEDYSENVTVGVVWKRGIGVTQDLGTKVIQIKRNCLNNIKIALGSDDRGAGVNMSLESESSMGNNNTDIPVQ